MRMLGLMFCNDDGDGGVTVSVSII
jgi:hypothetical protein